MSKLYMWMCSIYLSLSTILRNMFNRTQFHLHTFHTTSVLKGRELWKEVLVCCTRLMVYLRALCQVPKMCVLKIMSYFTPDPAVARTRRYLNKHNLPPAHLTQKIKTKLFCDKVLTGLLFLLVLLFAICFDRFYVRKHRPRGPIIHPMESGIQVQIMISVEKRNNVRSDFEPPVLVSENFLSLAFSRTCAE